MRRRALAAAAALVLIALGAAAWRWQGGPYVEAYRVERAELVHTIVASGRVESPRRVDVGSPLTGTVVAVPAAEGDKVIAGALLFALDDSEANAALELARSGVAQAEARLRQLRETGQPVASESLRQAEVNLTNAEQQWGRTRELFTRGFVGQAALDEATRARDVARSQLKSASLQRESQSPGGSDYLIAGAALAQARASLRAASARLDLHTVESPADGIVIARHVERGNVVQPGKALIVLAPSGETHVVVQLDERNVGVVRVGQAALVSADAYPAGRFPARVVFINPAVDATRGSVEVKLAVPSPPPYLLQDMTVSVDIEAARKPAALAIPAEALRGADSTAPWVLVERDGRAVRQAVKVGARGDGVVEVMEGLAEGDHVLANAPATIEGRRLRVSVRNGRSGAS